MRNYQKIKVLVATLLIVSLLRPISIFAKNSHEQKSITEVKQMLVEAGWNYDDIDLFLSKEELAKYQYAEVVGNVQEKYYRVTANSVDEISKEDCFHQIELLKCNRDGGVINSNGGATRLTIPIEGSVTNYQTTNDAYLKYTLTILRTNIYTYRITAAFQWLLQPATRSVDVFAISTNNNLQVQSYDRYFNYSVTGVHDNGATSHYSYSNPSEGWAAATNGMAAVFNLVNDIPSAGDSITMVNHHGVMSVWAIASYGSGGIPTGNVVADYFHQKLQLGIVPSISFTPNIELSASVSIGMTFTHMLSNISMNFNLDD